MYKGVCVCVCKCVCVCDREGSGGSQGLDQVQFVSLLTGEDGCLFVVFNKLFHRVELALSNAVKVFLQLHFEMLVLALRLQGDGEVVWLRKEKQTQSFIIGQQHPYTFTVDFLSTMLQCV